MQVLKYTDYENIIHKQMYDYRKFVEESKKIYYDFDDFLKLITIEPLSYYAYCETNNYKPEPEEIKEEIKEK